jgi:hypothetical protein
MDVILLSSTEWIYFMQDIQWIKMVSNLDNNIGKYQTALTPTVLALKETNYEEYASAVKNAWNNPKCGANNTCGYPNSYHVRVTTPAASTTPPAPTPPAECWRKMPEPPSGCGRTLSEPGSGGTGVVWFKDPHLSTQTSAACTARASAYNNYCRYNQTWEDNYSVNDATNLAGGGGEQYDCYKLCGDAATADKRTCAYQFNGCYIGTSKSARPDATSATFQRTTEIPVVETHWGQKPAADSNA